MNKLSLNADKTKYIFLHKQRDKDPTSRARFKYQQHFYSAVNKLKFLGVFLVENLNWKSYIALILNEVLKNIRLLFKPSLIFSKKCLLKLYFSYIHSYINYANIVWSSTSHTKLKKILTMQKHAIRIIFNVHKETHIRALFQELNALNVY